MEDWKERIIDELKELYERENKLRVFIHTNSKFDNLSDTEKELLLKQLKGMTTYLEALEDRLEYYKIKVE